MDLKKLRVTVWRRGRGLSHWLFRYIDYSGESWFSTPGWYRPSGRGRMYRLTIDHDYPTKPIWLGYRAKGRTRKWVNSESLYEVVMVSHPTFFISNSDFKGAKHRSQIRREVTGLFLSVVGLDRLKTQVKAYDKFKGR